MFQKSFHTRTDEQLMQLLVQGNRTALNELYNRYSKKMLRYFFRMLWKDEAKAQDFLQDLFLKVIENPDRFDAERKFSTWMYSVANNMCKNEYRKQAFRKTTIGLDGIHEPEDSALADETDFKIVLDRAINCLSEEDRNLYALRFEAEASMEEISLILGIPVGTCKSRLFYLKKNLASRLAPGLKKINYGI